MTARFTSANETKLCDIASSFREDKGLRMRVGAGSETQKAARGSEERQAALLSEKRTLEEQLANLDDSGMTGPQRLADFLERLGSAHSLYESGTIEEKRELLAQFTSNWLATGRDVDFTVLPEVQLVANRPRNLFDGPQRDRPRTAYQRRLDGRAEKDQSQCWIDFSFSLPSSSSQD